MATQKGHENILDLVADPNKCFRGSLGHFSLQQKNRLGKLFQPHGQVPWNDLVNPPWSELLTHLEEAWLALNSGFVPPVEERLPIAQEESCLPQNVLRITCVPRSLLLMLQQRLWLLRVLVGPHAPSPALSQLSPASVFLHTNFISIEERL